jgi:hypothetical protein
MASASFFAFVTAFWCGSVSSAGSDSMMSWAVFLLFGGAGVEGGDALAEMAGMTADFSWRGVFSRAW